MPLILKLKFNQIKVLVTSELSVKDIFQKEIPLTYRSATGKGKQRINNQLSNVTDTIFCFAFEYSYVYIREISFITFETKTIQNSYSNTWLSSAD